jgi:hypothetical protein
MRRRVPAGLTPVKSDRTRSVKNTLTGVRSSHAVAFLATAFFVNRSQAA